MILKAIHKLFPHTKMYKHKIISNSEHRLIFQYGGETPPRAETPRDSVGNSDNETYEQKTERFQNARQAIEKEIKETDDPALKQKLQEEYDAFLAEGSKMFRDLQDLGVTKDKIMEASLRRLARFTDRTGLGQKAEKPEVNVKKIQIDPALDKGIQTEIQSENVLRELSTKPSYVAASGRAYRMVDGRAYYNSRPREKNTWGNITNDQPTFAEMNGKFVELKVVGAYNSVPRVWESADGRMMFDEGGNVVQPDSNGVYKHPNSEYARYKRVNGEWELCDSEGRLRNEYINDMVGKLIGAGFQAGYADGLAAFDARKVSIMVPTGSKVSPDEKVDVPLFRIEVAMKDGKYVIETKAENEETHTSVESVIRLANERKVKVTRFLDKLQNGEKPQTNKERFQHYGELFDQLMEVRDTFSRASLDKDWLSSFANNAAWAVVENHMNNNMQGLKLEDGNKYVQFLHDQLEDSYYPDPNQADTVAQFYKLQFQREGSVRAKEQAIGLLQSTIQKARERWDRFDEDDRQQVEKNEQLLDELKKI